MLIVSLIHEPGSQFHKFTHRYRLNVF